MSQTMEKKASLLTTVVLQHDAISFEVLRALIDVAPFSDGSWCQKHT